MENIPDIYENSADKAWQAILSKVKELDDSGVKRAEISRLLGHEGRSAVSNWVNGETTAKNASFADMLRYIDKLGLVIDDYLPKKTPQIRRTGINAPVENVEGEDLQKVPVYSVAGAGPGVMLDSIEPMFTVVAPPDYFRKSDCAVMVEGHSMEPLIPHGAIVGINRNADFQANELFLAHIPYEGYVIKRVAVDIERQEYVFKSENANKIAYPDFRISINESEKIIVGRVVWIMWGY